MKKITCLLIALMTLSLIGKGQNDCINAKNIALQGNDTIPPAGTISPTGPDLGCLTETGRQMWYYITVCQTTYAYDIQLIYESITFDDSIGMVFYGPFSQKVSNCSDLASNKIISCNEEDGYIQDPDLFITDSLYEGNYYYLLITYSDLIPASNYSFDFTVDDMSHTIYNCFECNNQVSVLNQKNLCLVSVDTAINKCVLTWEEFQGRNLMGYNILRESSLTGVFDSLTTIPLGGMSTYTDPASSPVQHNVTYAVAGVDSCGQSYPIQNLYPTLTSIHLISFAGGNNQANLIWNNVYTNNNFVPQYFIYRNNNGTGWQVIDSIGITLSAITYTDIFAPAGTNQYTVELRKLVPCVPMRTSSNSFQSVFSNTTITFVTGEETFADNSYIRIYPNPATDFISIYYNLSSAPQLTVDLFNLYGQKLNTLFAGRSDMGKQEVKVSLKEYAAGIYFVKITADGKEQMRKVLKL